MARYLVLDKNNKVLNSIEWDGVRQYNPGKDLTLRLEERRGNPGDLFNGRDFISPIKDITKDDLFAEEVKAIDDDPATVGTFQRFVTAVRTKLGF